MMIEGAILNEENNLLNSLTNIHRRKSLIYQYTETRNDNYEEENIKEGNQSYNGKEKQE